MKWMRERDLLIAQTMAFVQSVTGKMPEAEKTVAEKTVTTSVALLSVETSETIRAATLLPAIEFSAGGDAARCPGAERRTTRSVNGNAAGGIEAGSSCAS